MDVQEPYDPEDALACVRGVANILNRMATCSGGGSWAYDEQTYALLGRDLLEAADALEDALDRPQGSDNLDGCRRGDSLSRGYLS